MKDKRFAIKCWNIENADSVKIMELVRRFSNHTSSYNKIYRLNNLQYIRKRSAKWKKADYHKFPDKHKAWSRKFYKDNIEKERERSKIVMKQYYKNQHKTYKTEVLMYYGNGKLSCVCCGEKGLKFLTIDHIIPIGSKNKKERTRRGFSQYKYLRKKNFPEGYQTLCFNCNQGRALNNGICPHQDNNKLKITIGLGF